MTHPELNFKLLNHPFYQAWNHGVVTKPQLAKYAWSYLNFIQKMPELWERVLSSMPQSIEGAEQVVADETQHIDLWQKWANKMECPENLDAMKECVDGFDQMSGAELLGALQAFETQQPDVAVTKKEGLLKHYGFSEEDTVYFDEHMNEHHHIALGEKIRAILNDETAYAQGFAKGQKLVYSALDAFVQ